MGKAAQRRKAYRVQTLSELAKRDINEFANEWQIRLRSWEKRIEEIMTDLCSKKECTVDIVKRAIKSALSIIKSALNELSECGIQAYTAFEKATCTSLQRRLIYGAEKLWDDNLINWAAELHRFSVIREALEEVSECGKQTNNKWERETVNELLKASEVSWSAGLCRRMTIAESKDNKPSSFTVMTTVLNETLHELKKCTNERLFYVLADIARSTLENEYSRKISQQYEQHQMYRITFNWAYYQKLYLKKKVNKPTSNSSK